MENQNQVPAQELSLQERVSILEKQIVELLAAKETKPRATVKYANDEERRLAINRMSRESKMRKRAADRGMTLEQYIKYQADKKAGIPLGWTDPADVEPTPTDEQVETEKAAKPETQPEVMVLLEEPETQTGEPKKRGGKKKVA